MKKSNDFPLSLEKSRIQFTTFASHLFGQNSFLFKGESQEKLFGYVLRMWLLVSGHRRLAWSRCGICGIWWYL